MALVFDLRTRSLMHTDHCPLYSASHSLGTSVAWELWGGLVTRQDGIKTVVTAQASGYSAFAEYSWDVAGGRLSPQAQKRQRDWSPKAIK